MASARRRIDAIARHLVQTPPGGRLAPRCTAASGRRILEGIKVVELATVVAAPACCAVLADLGADVLKIENPKEPDNTRAWWKNDDPARTADPTRKTGSHFNQLNRGKRAMALNYHAPDGLRILKQLMSEADVFVTNVRNKSLRKIGLDYESISKEYPRLIYSHLSAWGRDGPKRDDPGYDFGAFWAYTGIMEISRSSDDASMPRFPASFGDNTTAMMLVAGIALALLHRQATGEGQLVDAALLRSGVWALSHPMVAHAGGNKWAPGARNEGVRGSAELGKRSTTITSGVFRCKDDRWIYLLGMEVGKHWEKTLKVLGLQGKLQLSSKTDWVAATAMVDAIMAEKTYEEWHKIFLAADIWHAPVQNFEDLMADEQANAAGAFAEVPGLSHKLVKCPVRLSSQAGKDGPKGPAPEFGEHTSSVLGGLGYGEAEVARLRKEGVVR